MSTEEQIIRSNNMNTNIGKVNIQFSNLNSRPIKHNKFLSNSSVSPMIKHNQRISNSRTDKFEENRPKIHSRSSSTRGCGMYINSLSFDSSFRVKTSPSIAICSTEAGRINGERSISPVPIQDQSVSDPLCWGKDGLASMPLSAISLLPKERQKEYRTQIKQNHQSPKRPTLPAVLSPIAVKKEETTQENGQLRRSSPPLSHSKLSEQELKGASCSFYQRRGRINKKRAILLRSAIHCRRSDCNSPKSSPDSASIRGPLILSGSKLAKEFLSQQLGRKDDKKSYSNLSHMETESEFCKNRIGGCLAETESRNTGSSMSGKEESSKVNYFSSFDDVKMRKSMEKLNRSRPYKHRYYREIDKLNPNHITANHNVSLLPHQNENCCHRIQKYNSVCKSVDYPRYGTTHPRTNRIEKELKRMSISAIRSRFPKSYNYGSNQLIESSPTNCSDEKMYCSPNDNKSPKKMQARESSNNLEQQYLTIQINELRSIRLRNQAKHHTTQHIKNDKKVIDEATNKETGFPQIDGQYLPIEKRNIIYPFQFERERINNDKGIECKAHSITLLKHILHSTTQKRGKVPLITYQFLLLIQ